MGPRCLAAALLAATLACVLAITMTGFTTIATPTTRSRGSSSAATTHEASSTATCTVNVKMLAVSNTSGVDTTPGGGCDATKRSTDFVLWCVDKSDITSPMCCRTLLEAAESGGGLLCLCDMATTPAALTTGYSIGSIIAAYTSCGGPLRMDPVLAAKCDDY